MTQRPISSIRIGERHRKGLGDLTSLADSGWARKAHPAMRVQVESVADYRGVETPRRFCLENSGHSG
jgi:hypothetical protein